MSKEHKFIFNDTVVAVEEQYRGDLGCVMFGKKLKDGNINVFLETYSPSIVEFFVELQKCITDLQAKLNSYEEFYKSNGFKSKEDFFDYVINTMMNKEEKANKIKNLEAKLAESEKSKEINIRERDKICLEMATDYNKQILELKQQLAESKNEIEKLKSKEKKIRIHTKRDWFERCCQLEDENIILGLENKELKQQLMESDAYKLRIELAGATETIEVLRKQLAESEEKLKAMETLRQMVNEDKKLNFRRYVATLAKNEQLEQQLAEKEQEIEDMKDHQKDLCLRCGGLTHEQYEQDKIDFAVAELEKVKEKIWKIVLVDSSGDKYVDIEDVEFFIDQQIKKLKGE